MGKWISLICAGMNLGQVSLFDKFHNQLSTLLALFLQRLHNGFWLTHIHLNNILAQGTCRDK